MKYLKHFFIAIIIFSILFIWYQKLNENDNENVQVETSETNLDIDNIQNENVSKINFVEEIVIENKEPIEIKQSFTNKKLYKIDELTYKDDKWKLYVRKENEEIMWYQCWYYQEWYYDVYWTSNSSWLDCISLPTNAFITLEEAKKAIINTWRIEKIYKMKWINLETENFKDKTFVIEWKRIFLWDITDHNYFIFENINLYSQLYFLLFNSKQIKQNSKLFILNETWTNTFLVFQLFDDYKEMIEYIDKVSDKYYELSKQVTVPIKTISKKEYTLAQIYTIVLQNLTYCDECLEWWEKIYDWMNWIKTLYNKTWVCDWIVKAIYYVMKKAGYTIYKESWLWCSWNSCENHAWFKVNYSFVQKSTWKKVNLVRYYDPTFDLSTVDKDRWDVFQLWRTENQWWLIYYYMVPYFSKTAKEFNTNHFKDVFNTK